VSSELAASPIFVAAAAAGALGALMLFAAMVALARGRLFRFARRTLAGLLLLSLGGLGGALVVGTQGYRALTQEDLAAQLLVRPTGPQRFSATVRFPDGHERTYDLAGDEIYVDAHVLKWKPIANALGLHTSYELDRVAGRYHAIEDERTAARTVYSLGEDHPVDLFALRRRYAFLSPLLDADYGSAAFVPVAQASELELRVSTTGLLIREAK
jgi:hypothetical protein